MSETGPEKSFRAFSTIRKPEGFTLIEMLIAVAIIGILSAIAFPAYKSYIGKAKITLGISTLETSRKSLEDYHTNYSSYPATINFLTGLDDLDRTVFTPGLVEEFRSHLSSVDSYSSDTTSYTITAHAQDDAHTLLTLTAGGVVTVSP